jgi:hypothetical protein
MLPIKFAIAQGTKETSAPLAGTDRFFLRMVKTTGLALNHDGFAALPGVDAAEQGGENLHLQGHAASRAGRQFRLVENAVQQPGLAFGALNQ